MINTEDLLDFIGKDSIINYVRRWYNIEDIFEQKDVLRYIDENLWPEDCFTKDELSKWAYENGFVEDE